MNSKLLTIATLALLCAAAQAQIVNASFEADAVGAQSLNTSPISGWSTSGTGQGVWDIRGFGGFGSWTPFWNETAPDGNQIAYINDGNIAQQTTSAVVEGKQTFSVMAGNRADAAVSADFTVQLWAGGTVSNGSVSGGTFLASNLIQMAFITPGTFAPVSVSYNALAGDAAIGQLISVRIANFAGHQINVDKAELTLEPIPEPATLLALSAATLALLRKRKSR